jgi:hypothetical protein
MRGNGEEGEIMSDSIGEPFIAKDKTLPCELSSRIKLTCPYCKKEHELEHFSGGLIRERGILYCPDCSKDFRFQYAHDIYCEAYCHGVEDTERKIIEKMGLSTMLEQLNS